MTEEKLEDEADPDVQDEDELGLGSEGEIEKDEVQEKQDSKDEDDNTEEDGKGEPGEEKVNKDDVKDETENHEGESGLDGKIVPHDEEPSPYLPDSQPILNDVAESQVGDGYGDRIIPASPPPTQPSPVIEIEDTPEKAGEPIQNSEKFTNQRNEIEDSISELTQKLNHAKKLMASKRFGLN